MRIPSNFLKRSITAVVLAGIAAVSVIWLDQQKFWWINTAFLLCLGWEWSSLSGWAATRSRVYYLLLLITGSQLIAYLSMPQVAKGAACMGALLILNFVVTIARGDQPSYSFRWVSVLGALNLTLIWYVLLILKSKPHLLCLGLIIVGLTDTLAYIIGSQWGVHHLAVNVSPRKTWEGCIAGLLGPCLIVKSAYLLNIIAFGSTSAEVMMVILTSLGAVAGDLFESALKRRHGLKDSGRALPGHGGWLDRFDGLIGAMPVFFVGLFYLSAL